jgi:hypothetical protein
MRLHRRDACATKFSEPERAVLDLNQEEAEGHGGAIFGPRRQEDRNRDLPWSN